MKCSRPAAGTSSLAPRRGVHLVFIFCIQTPVCVALLSLVQEPLFLGAMLAFVAFLALEGWEAGNTFRQLVESQFELEAKNFELEQFTHTVSHDLKSPLITIQGFLGYFSLLLDALLGRRILGQPGATRGSGRIGSFHSRSGRTRAPV